jgi:hypothetical protein
LEVSGRKVLATITAFHYVVDYIGRLDFASLGAVVTQWVALDEGIAALTPAWGAVEGVELVSSSTSLGTLAAHFSGVSGC